MKEYVEQLEGTQRLVRIRRIRRVVWLLLLLVIVLFSAYAMVLAGASFKPLFLPINAFLGVVLIVLFVAALGNFVFRAFEIRQAKWDSQRFLLARNSYRRAGTSLALGVVLGLVLLLPATSGMVHTLLSQDMAGTIDRGETIFWEFENQDAFAIAQFTEGRVAIRGSRLATVIVTNEFGEVTQTVQPGQPYRFAVDTRGLLHYRLTIENLDNRPLTYEVQLEKVLMRELTSIVPVMLFAFAAANAVWMSYLRPLEKQYEASSIYSVRYVEQVAPGERTYADYYRPPIPMTASFGGPAIAPAPTPLPNPSPAAPARVVSVPPVPPPAPVEEVVAPEEPPKDVAALMSEGSRLFSEGHHEVALAKFDEILEVEPHHIHALLAGASALLRLNRREEALAAYASILEIDPRNAKALATRAQILEEDRRWREASEAWATYLQVVPADIDARLHRAEVLFAMGDRAGAVKALEEALFLAPSDERIRARIDDLRVDAPALLSKALVASASGKYEEAIALFDRILASDPDNLNALVSKGVALRRAGRPDEAIAALDAALGKQPGNDAALRAKGSILEERGRFAEALDVYGDLLETAPRDPEVWALQATVLEKLGKGEEALASYREALKVDPSNEAWQARAAALEAARKGQEKFLEELFTIKGVGPARARALLAAGYTTIDALRNATEDELANVHGVTRQVAADIFRHFHPA